MTTRVGVKKLESVKLIDLQNTQFGAKIWDLSKQYNTIQSRLFQAKPIWDKKESTVKKYIHKNIILHLSGSIVTVVCIFADFSYH